MPTTEKNIILGLKCIKHLNSLKGIDIRSLITVLATNAVFTLIIK